MGLIIQHPCPSCKGIPTPDGVDHCVPCAGTGEDLFWDEVLMACPGCQAATDSDHCKLCIFLGRIGVQLCPDPEVYNKQVWRKAEKIDHGMVNPAISAAFRLGGVERTQEVVFDLLEELAEDA